MVFIGEISSMLIDVMDVRKGLSATLGEWYSRSVDWLKGFVIDTPTLV